MTGSDEAPPTPGLSGVRVLEIGSMVSAPYATKLLADLGAEVVKVERPGGDPARHRGPFVDDVDPDASGLFLALNTNKSSVVVDGADDLAPYLTRADIVITNWSTDDLAAVGVEVRSLLAQRPELVVCSITPFGLTGPRRDHAAVELTVAHAGGWAYQCPGASEATDKPPLKVFGHQTDFHAGLAGATAALAAFTRAQRTGVGELIDLASVANTAGMLEAALIVASYQGEDPNRLGSRLLNPWQIFPCSDGLIFLVTVEQDQWERLVDLMGRPDWVETGLFDTNELRHENRDLLSLYISEWTAEQTVDELWHKGQSERICLAPVLTMAELANQDHLRARGFLVPVDHPRAGRVVHLGPPFQTSTELWAPLVAAPTLDRTSKPSFGPGRPGPDRRTTDPDGSTRPLDGLRILDLSWVWAGPYATLHLAFLGAEVIKVESSQRPGLGRRLPLGPPDLEPTLNTSSYFNQWDQAKLSCELDLSQPEGIELVEQLVERCDVVVENFATGVMERLGLGYERLRTINPEIIVASISGYGSQGPLADYMGYGPTTGPLSGLTSLTGYPDGPPEELGVSFGDPAAGMMAAFAIMAAVVARSESGQGCYLDVALWEATASNAVEGWMATAMGAPTPDRMGNRDPLVAPHGCYPTAPDPDATTAPDPDLDPGHWISLACPTDDHWLRLASLIDPALVDDERFETAKDRKVNEDELDAIVSTWTATSDRWALTEQLQRIDIPAYPSMSPLDLLAEDHWWSRQFFQRLDHPEVGRRTHTGPPWLLANSPNGVTAPAPLLGEHTGQVLGDLLGVSAEDLKGLRQRGIVG